MSLSSVLTFLLVLARVSAFLAVFPLFARRQVPALVKTALAMALSIFWFATLPQPLVPEKITSLDVNTIAAALWMVREIMIGWVLGMLAGLFLIPARIAGAYVGQEFGLTLAATADPSSPDASGEITQLFEALSILGFFALNLHHFVIVMLHVSWERLGPAIGLADLPSGPIADLFGNLDRYGLTIIAPLAICMFALNLAMVLLNKVAPSLNLFSVGMSVRGVVGLLCLFLFLPVIFRAVALYFDVTQVRIQNLLGG